MRKPSPQAVKAQKYLDKFPVTSPKALQHKFGISYQVAYNLTKGRRRRETSQPQLTEFKTQEHNIIQGYTGKQYEPMNITVPLFETPFSVEEVLQKAEEDEVNSPAHYTVGGIEVIDFIEAKKLNYRLGNVIKYICRADHKGKKMQDLEKAKWYLEREIKSLKEN